MRHDVCPKCGGTGIDPNSYDEHIITGAYHIIARPCPKCKGKPNGAKETMSEKLKEKAKKTCPMCKGTGLIDHVYPSGCGRIIHEDIACPLCQGRGVES